MEKNSKVHLIPAKPPKRDKRVGIYSRVSTSNSDQLKSLSAQVSAFAKLIAATPYWLLEDVYMDIASSKKGSKRREFNRMLEDCRSQKLDIIITKSISRFGRDTVEILESLNQLKALGVRVIFHQEELDTANTSSELMISIVESIAQAENESRSENIKWGITKRAKDGTSKLYDRWSGEIFNAFSSVHSEASEYAQFVIVILKREGLSPTTFDEMLKEQIKFSDDNPLKQETGQTGWGLGFTQKITPDYTMHFHTGNNHDFQAYVMFILEKQYGIVAFINSNQMATFLESLSEIIEPQF